MKHLILTILALVTYGLAAEAQYNYGRPYPYPQPYPYPAPYPRPYYPPPYVPVAPVIPVIPSYVYTCNAVGLYNGLIFYGVGTDTYTANQRALYACQLSGQACQLVGCR